MPLLVASHWQAGPRTRLTQAQVGFSAHSASQLQALVFSSQYQPVGQMPLPQTLQVPSSQLGPFALSRSAGASASLSLAAALGLRRLAEEELDALSAADCGGGSVGLPPQAGKSKSRARQPGNARMLTSVYVPGPGRYKRLWIRHEPRGSCCLVLPRALGAWTWLRRRATLGPGT